MSLLLSTVLTAIRDRHPAFHRTRVPNAVLGRFLSDYQNELIGKAVERDPGYLTQTLAIALSVDDANDPGTVGAGTTGALPGEVSSGGGLSVVEESAGALVFPLRTTAEGANIVVADRLVTAATSTSVSSTGAARTTNADALRLVIIVDGKGKGQERAVISNTAEQWVISTGSDGKQWTTTPDTTSLMRIVQVQLTADETLGVVTEIPARSARTGYLVRLTAQGAPYIDYTEPKTVWVGRGVPIPSMLAPLSGTLRSTEDEDCELCITTKGRRYDPPAMPAVYLENQSLFLCGGEGDWEEIESIELQYVPVSPEFDALTNYFLVPDAARPALVAQGAAFAAERIAGLEGIAIDPDRFAVRGAQAEVAYLSTLRLAKRSRRTTFRGGSY